MTHVEKQQALFAEITERVCALLSWPVEKYAAYIEKCGKQYLQHYIPQDPAGIDMLVASRWFWSWWRTNWYKRDAKFAFDNDIHDFDDVEGRRAVYANMHDARTLARHIYPNGQVLHESYHIMIGVVIDQAKEEAL